MSTENDVRLEDAKRTHLYDPNAVRVSLAELAMEKLADVEESLLSQLVVVKMNEDSTVQIADLVELGEKIAELSTWISFWHKQARERVYSVVEKGGDCVGCSNSNDPEEVQG